MCDDPVADRDEPVIGVLEPADHASDVFDAVEGVLEDRDGDGDNVEAVVSGTLQAILDADPEPTILVAVGTDGVSASGAADHEIPILPVGDVTGITAVAPSMVGPALESVLDGEAELESRAVLDVQVEPTEGGSREPTGNIDRAATTARGVFDVILDTDEPARISAFSVSSRGEPVSTFRADGVVAATPAGSHGYAKNVDAPALSPAVDAVAVSPIAPFATRTRRWVLPADDVRVIVERDECTVDLVVDGQPVATLESGWVVRLRSDGSLSVVVPDRGHERSKKE